jgi:hypothetical protein
MHIARVLEQLANATDSKAQVLVSTHSPHFVTSRGFENIRVVRKLPVQSCSLVTGTTYTEISNEIAAALGEKPSAPTSVMASVEQIMQPSQRELFFTRFAILVEGNEDVAFISAQLHLSGKWEEFRRTGCHFVVAVGKTNLSRPLVIAKKLGIETFTVFDGDNKKVKPAEKSSNERNNRCLLRLLGEPGADPNSTGDLWGHRHVMWGSTILDAVVNEIGQPAWDKAETDARKNSGYQDGVQRKNPLLIGATLEILKGNGVTCKTLTGLCDSILRCAGLATRQAALASTEEPRPPPVAHLATAERGSQRELAARVPHKVKS